MLLTYELAHREARSTRDLLRVSPPQDQLGEVIVGAPAERLDYVCAGAVTLMIGNSADV